MSTPTLEIGHRPFCVEPFTNFLLPDGIFDSAITILDIAFYIRNNSDSTLRNVRAIVDQFGTDGSPWEYPSGKEIIIDKLPPGANHLCRIRAHFKDVAPGKYPITISYGSESIQSPDVIVGEYDSEILDIFVSKTAYDKISNTYRCTVPEGELRLEFSERLYFPPILSDKVNDDVRGIQSLPSIPFPIRVKATVVSTPGNEEHIPFNDPWWKVIAWIIAAVAAIAALIAAKEGEGTARVDLTGEGQDDLGEYDICFPDTKSSGDPTGLAGYLSILASIAFRVGLADDKDPWQRGREHFFDETNGILPIAEVVEARISPPERIGPGADFEVPVNWKYQRILSASDVREMSVSETRKNPHIVSNLKIDCKAQVVLYSPIDVYIEMANESGLAFAGRDTIGTIAFVPPDRRLDPIRVQLLDYERPTGVKLPDGKLHARLDTEEVATLIGPEATLGRWELLIYVQNTNMTRPGTEALVAAMQVGGDFLVGPRDITFAEAPMTDTDRSDASKQCPYDEQIHTVVEVINR